MILKNYITLIFFITIQLIGYSQNDDIEIIRNFLSCNLKNGEYVIKSYDNYIPLRKVTVLPEIIFFVRHSLFGRKQVTLIQEVNNKYYIRYKDSNEDINRLKLSGFDVEISLNDVELIKKLISIAIKTSKYIEEIPGSDGTDYLFGVNDKDFLTGELWSPNYDKKKMNELKKISLSIAKLAIYNVNEREIKLDEKLKKQIKNLILEFKK